jgi:Fe-S-cluster containining protein
MKEDIQPDQVRRLTPGEMFSFGCGPHVPCFNGCCRELELALTPYDAARLRKNLVISASEFLDHYCLVERKNDTSLPEVYLGMVDDGLASCPFVSPAGCQVYQDRPSACRMYPLGRAAGQTPEGKKREFHVLLSEPHCQGLTEKTVQDVEQWTAGQGLVEYNAANDRLMAILQHRKAKQVTSVMAETFLETLFNLDGFRARILAPKFTSHTLPTAAERLALATDDLVLLGFAIRWLRYELFNE